MADAGESSAGAASQGRGRGRGKSRGGLGKYLRARGRGRGMGRPAQFGTRLLLEGEGAEQLTEEEQAERAQELAQKYSRRSLGTNADRYKEEEVELDSDGEPIVEPEVDLSAFLEKQKISDDAGPLLSAIEKKKDYDDDDVDTSLAHITSKPTHIASQAVSKKGKVEQIVWDAELDEMSREKKAAEATWDLKNRFRAKSDKLRAKPAVPSSSTRTRKQEYQEAPALPLPEGTQVKPKTQLEEMEEFLDDLLP